MSGKKQLAGRIAVEWNNNHPTWPNLTLARAMQAAEPKVFLNLKTAESHLRYLRGKIGSVHRKKIGMKIELPPSDERQWLPYVVTDCRRALILADVHVPYHNREALEIAVRTGKEKKCDVVILDGDSIDFYQLSRFCKDPRKRSVKGELEALRWVIDYIREELGDPKVIYKEGNHEERLEHFLYSNAPQLIDMDGLTIASAINAVGEDIKMVNEKRIIKFGHLNILHGHEIGSGIFSPVNFARTLYLKTGECTVAGHLHQSSQHSETTINGRNITCWSIGCLSELHPLYRPINKWNFGFAIAEKTKGENFNFQNFKIIDGEAYPA